MTGYLEPLCEHVSFLRLGVECLQYGDPWEWGVTIVHQSGAAALIVGLYGTVKPSYWRGVMRVLSDAGVDVMRFYRRDKSGAMVLHEHATRRARGM